MSLIERVKSWVRLGRKREAPLISVVLFFRNPIRLTEERLHRALVTAWGRDTKKDANEYVVTKPPIGFIQFEGMLLQINNVGKPYCTEEYRNHQAAEELREMRQLKVVLEHRAFFTVDLMHPKNPKRKVKQECYRRMCSLAAEFVDDNCMGASFPETGHLRPYDLGLKDALKSDRPLEAITEWERVPAILIDEDESKLHAATEEARRRWPEFVGAFHSRRDGQIFSVKAPFRDGEEVEWMWVTVSEVTEDAVEGSLGNAPVNLHNIREGDSVRLPVSAIADWAYAIGDKLIGGFSLKVLRNR